MKSRFPILAVCISLLFIGFICRANAQSVESKQGTQSKKPVSLNPGESHVVTSSRKLKRWPNLTPEEDTAPKFEYSCAKGESAVATARGSITIYARKPFSAGNFFQPKEWSLLDSTCEIHQLRIENVGPGKLVIG